MKYQDGIYRDPMYNIVINIILNHPLLIITPIFISLLVFIYITLLPFLMDQIIYTIASSGMDPSIVTSMNTIVRLMPLTFIIFICVTVIRSVIRSLYHQI